MNQSHRLRMFSEVGVLLGMSLLLAACAFSLPIPGAPAMATPGLTPMRVCYSTVSGTQIAAWYAFEKGLFRDYGLDVELIGVEGGEQAATTLITGAADICQGSPSAMIAAAVAGADTVTIAGIVNTLPYSMMVRPEITTVEDLRGGVLAVNSLGGSAAVAARASLLYLGLKPDEDVAIVAVGGQGERLAAMLSGAVQATLVSPPQTVEAKEMGFKALFDTADMGVPSQHTAINTTRRYLAGHRPEAVAFMKAIVTALALIREDAQGTKDTMAKYMALDPETDAASLDEAYTELIRKYIVSVPYPTLEGIQTELGDLAHENPAALKVKAADIVDLSIVKELEESGFIASLSNPR